jgi:hypothetical protein
MIVTAAFVYGIKFRPTTTSPSQNSNLVLRAERDGRRHREPTGEPETLRGRDLLPMGDRAREAAPKALKDARGHAKCVFQMPNQLKPGSIFDFTDELMMTIWIH